MSDADDVLRHLDDPRALCEALGYVDGRKGRDWQPQAGRGVLVRCPWHDERTPSCSITRGPDGTIRAKCFGCSATGNAFDLIAQWQGWDKRARFRDVLDLAHDLANLPRPERREARAERPPVASALPRAPLPELPETRDDDALAQVATVLSHVAPVAKSAEGMAYLASRGLDGTGAEGWYLLPSGVARDAVTEAVLEAMGHDAWLRSGLASPSGGWARSWGGPRLVIPWRGPDGAVSSLQGRYLGRDAGANRFAFPVGHGVRWPYGSDALVAAPRDVAVAITEGAIDAESFTALARAAGVAAMAVALPSVGAWEASWFRLFAGRACIAALDADEAGAKHTPGLVERLAAVAMRGQVTVRTPRGGKDWNDVLRARVGAAKTEAA